MKLNCSFIALAAYLVTPAAAAVGMWAQCGGKGYAGDTVCVDGATCTFSNDFYSQCLPSSATTTKASTTSKSTSVSTTKTTSVSTTTSKPTTTTSSAPSSSTIPVPSPSGFVKVSGQKFTLNGAPFALVGTNSYWVGLQGLSASDINLAFQDMAKSGATTVRTWGFNDVTSAIGSPYYQSWNGATPTINTGSLGLQNFDLVVAGAKAAGIKLIVALTNNWKDYGGMDVYTQQIAGSKVHGDFYTTPAIQTAFKNYVKTFVTRYKNDPTILSWELANEPRCNGCSMSVLTTWIKDTSAYIKSIDSNHLVAIGDEGWYNKPGSTLYPYQGSEGVDFDANLAISTIDFGTFHLYPESWGQEADAVNFGLKWITDHAASQKTQNKPVILEEFGVTKAKFDQVAVYTKWLDAVVSSGLSGELIWQAGSKLGGYTSYDDGYTYYPGDGVYALLQKYSATIKARA